MPHVAKKQATKMGKALIFTRHKKLGEGKSKAQAGQGGIDIREAPTPFA